MTSDHGFWLTNNFERIAIERCLHDTVIELKDNHILHDAITIIRYELGSLNFVGAKAPIKVARII